MEISINGWRQSGLFMNEVISDKAFFFKGLFVPQIFFNRLFVLHLHHALSYQ